MPLNKKPTTNNQRPTTNFLTFDIEDYFHVSAFEAVSPPESWEGRERRVEGNTERLLGVLDEHGVTATFFVLGWVAERAPGLVRRIAAAGHEVASHGYGHRRVGTQTRDEFRDDVRRAKALLEDLSGQPVRGYRAPSYSIGPTCLWAFDELIEAGHTYDSSVFPVRHDLYGLSDWPRFPFFLERLEGEGAGNWVPAEEVAPDRRGQGGRGPESRNPAWPAGGNQQPTTNNQQPLLEVPITTLRLAGRSVPIAGGGYFRLFPYRFTRWGLRRINEREGRPFVFYLHPWELDPGQPRIDGAGLKSRLRHYLNLEKTEGRLRRLLRDFRFRPIGGEGGAQRAAPLDSPAPPGREREGMP
ncbi:MAG: DUF3473 domain-containing protein [Deferrisomatales bacterium]